MYRMFFLIPSNGFVESQEIWMGVVVDGADSWMAVVFGVVLVGRCMLGGVFG